MLGTLSDNIGNAIIFAFDIAGKYHNLVFTILIIIGLVFIISFLRESLFISKRFSFRRLVKAMRKHEKQPKPKTDNENCTMVGLNGRRPVYVPDNAKHVFICGTTGSGKTVALSNFVQHGIEKGYPLVIVDGKGDIGKGSILDICHQLCRDSKTKLYVVNLSNPDFSVKYNPFRNANPTMCKDMLINMTEWSEEHYKLNTERYLQRLIQLLKTSEIPLSFKTIIRYMPIDMFTSLSNDLLKDKIISKDEHLLNLEIAKNSGKIAGSAVARFSTIAEGELGDIFADDGIDIYTAIQERAIILFVLNPLMYPEVSPLMGRLAIIDAKQAVNRCFHNPIDRAFYIFDEISSYASTALIDLINKSRSANITAILATQSLSDLDYTDEAFKEQVIENCNNYIVLRQNSAKNSEEWATILGTRQTMEVTHQIEQQSRFTNTTGLGSAKPVREFIYHPDEIKTLKVGKGFYLSKDMEMHCRLSVNKPF
ncbi:MAG: type IV secretion system DNA-binding domain-containing protein [Oscillospiraceae bacterium]|nr:type IV secretion system DNA-binding domain-containing protein [Oscillospiraceae bacterium]